MKKNFFQVICLSLAILFLFGFNFDPYNEIRDRKIDSYEEEIKKARKWAMDVRDSQVVDAIESLARRVSLLEEKDKPTSKE